MANPPLLYGDLKTQYKSNSNHKLARYTNVITNLLDDTKVYNSIYYLTGNTYTLVAYEFSQDDESFEKYLWSSKRE